MADSLNTTTAPEITQTRRGALGLLARAFAVGTALPVTQALASGVAESEAPENPDLIGLEASFLAAEAAFNKAADAYLPALERGRALWPRVPEILIRDHGVGEIERQINDRAFEPTRFYVPPYKVRKMRPDPNSRYETTLVKNMRKAAKKYEVNCERAKRDSGFSEASEALFNNYTPLQTYWLASNSMPATTLRGVVLKARMRAAWGRARNLTSLHDDCNVKIEVAISEEIVRVAGGHDGRSFRPSGRA